jgi:hypothetical protein
MSWKTGEEKMTTRKYALQNNVIEPRARPTHNLAPVTATLKERKTRTRLGREASMLIHLSSFLLKHIGLLSLVHKTS